MRIDIPEGGEVPEGNWLICHGSVWGRLEGKEDYQGWYWVLRLPFYHWFADREMWYRETWAQRCLWIRHLWLGNGRTGKNGMGWQGWDWSFQWMKCE